MENLTFYYSIVEKAIAKIGLDPQKTRTKNAGKWALTKGTVPVWVDIIYIQNENRLYFQVTSPVLKRTAANQAQMALELLEINNGLYGVAFTAHKDRVFIRTIREAEGLDIQEAHAMIMRVGNYSERYRNVLGTKYPVAAPVSDGSFAPNVI